MVTVRERLKDSGFDDGGGGSTSRECRHFWKLKKAKKQNLPGASRGSSPGESRFGILICRTVR